MFTYGLTHRQAFEVMNVKLKFIWKALGGSRSLCRYNLPDISKTEVASANLA